MAEKKYREYTYSYDRYNPQLGCHEHTRTVIAFSKANAIKLAKRSCDGAIYGSDFFKEIVSVGPVLTEGKDYRLVERYNAHATYSEHTYETVAEKIC